MEQRCWSVKKSLSHLRTFSSTFFFLHSFWFGLMAAWREENTFTQRTLSLSRVFFPFKILNVKEWFLKIMQSISWTWPKQKVCFFCFQQLKYKLESLLAVYFTGIHQMYIMSQCAPHARTSREQAHKCRCYWAGPKPQGCPGERCWLLRAAGLVLDEGPADTGLVLCHWFTLFAMYFPLPASPLGRKRSPFPPPVSFVTGGMVWDSEPAYQTGMLAGVICSDLASMEPRITWWESGAAGGDMCITPSHWF